MSYAIAAQVVLALHLGFIAFVIGGGLLVVRWRRLMALHLPAVAWGVYVEISGRICPLTHLENWLRAKAGESGYRGGFVEHYLLAIIYPAGLTRAIQFLLAAFVFAVNLSVYAGIFRRWRAARSRGGVWV